MDRGKGFFEMLDDAKVNDFLGGISDSQKRAEVEGRIFKVGEEVQVKGSRFRITKITTKKMTLRLLPQETMTEG